MANLEVVTVTLTLAVIFPLSIAKLNCMCICCCIEQLNLEMEPKYLMRTDVMNSVINQNIWRTKSDKKTVKSIKIMNAYWLWQYMLSTNV